jgi:TDG/mug DNA glycosylase family protein
MDPGIATARGAPITEAPLRPTKEDVAAAEGKTIEDVIAPDLAVLFCGINPGLYSGATGHHFARPGNRFWKTLHLAGFTPRVLAPHEQAQLLDHGLGVTNLVRRATATAAQLTEEELRAGGASLRAKVERLRPRVLAVLGVSAFRIAFRDRDARVGPQEETIGVTQLWVLPNPSGLNAHYQLPALTERFVELRRALD